MVNMTQTYLFANQIFSEFFLLITVNKSLVTIIYDFFILIFHEKNKGLNFFIFARYNNI